LQPPPIVAGAHKPAGHRAGVLGVLEKQSSGDGESMPHASVM
jgi:hypothetical protein